MYDYLTHRDYNCIQYGLYLTLSILQRFEEISKDLPFIPVLSKRRSRSSWSRSLNFIQRYPTSSTCARVIEAATRCTVNNISTPIEALQNQGLPAYDSLKCMKDFCILDAVKMLLDTAIDINDALCLLLKNKDLGIKILRNEQKLLAMFRDLLFPGQLRKLHSSRANLPPERVSDDFIAILLNMSRYLEIVNFTEGHDLFHYSEKGFRGWISDRRKVSIDFTIRGLALEVKKEYADPFKPFLKKIDAGLIRARKKWKKMKGTPLGFIVSREFMEIVQDSMRDYTLAEMAKYSGERSAGEYPYLKEWSSLVLEVLSDEYIDLHDFSDHIHALVSL